ncbi:MAG: MATE family efflux transporter, partial [Oscillibacter sp.]|nr:MATE family efflux transporter [Oscillibacter sp.]
METTEHDLLQGSITRRLIRLAAPLIAGNILQQFYNTFDVFVIGRYAGELEYAAIGTAGTLMNLFLFAVSGMCGGMLVLFARHFGASDAEAFRREHAAALLLGLGVTLLLAAAGLGTLSPVLRAIRTPEEIVPYAGRYLIIIFLGLPFTFLYNLYGSMLRAVGETRTATLALLLAVLLNLGLDLLLVAALRLGVSGAALATVASQLAAALICLGAVILRHRDLLFRPAYLRLEPVFVRRTLSTSLVTALHQSSIYLGKILVQGTVNSQGLDLISAYTTTGRIEGFANSFGDSGAAATSILAAQNYGAGREDRVRETFSRSFRLLFLFGIVISALMFVTAPLTVGLLLGNRESAAFYNAVDYLRLISVFYVFCFTGNTFAGWFEGIGRVRIPFAGAASHLTIRILLSALWIARFRLPAVAVATGIGWV